jgi:endonuclease III
MAPVKDTADTRAIVAELERQHPNAVTALEFSDPFELLVATILSAQTTDEGVNRVTPALFERYPDAKAMAGADSATVERLIQSTGFFRQKSRALIGMARALVERHGGQVPASMEDLVRLPGVGRKTANVVLGHALGVPGLAVDRHVLRVADRIGIASSTEPEEVERQLCQHLPPESWTVASDTLIAHGRLVCKPKPLCDRCSVRRYCRFFLSAAGCPPAGRTTGSKPRKRRKAKA